MTDRTDDIRAAVLHARRMAWAATVAAALELCEKNEPMLARAVLHDLLQDMDARTKRTPGGADA